MACGCKKVVRGFEPGTYNGTSLIVDGALFTVDGTTPVVFAGDEQAEQFVIEQGFADWELVPVTV